MTGTRSETGLTATTGALAGAAAILLVVLGVVAVQQGVASDDTDPAGGEPTASSGTTMSPSPSDDEPSESASPSSEPDEAWVAEAVRAAKDGYPAFVPAEVPRDWTVDVASYEKDARWRMELTSASGGTVVIDQRSGDDLEPGLRSALGSPEKAGSVNLKRWGTGTWAAYEGGGAYALAQGLANTAVVVSGSDEADVLELTKLLLTAEMVVNVGDGSDG